MWYICHIIFLYLKRIESIFVIYYINNENLNIFIEYIRDFFKSYYFEEINIFIYNRENG